MKRIFTAIDVSESVRKQTADYIESLRREFSTVRVGWEQTQKLHLTLKFLGDIDDGRLADLIEAVGTTARQISEFEMRIVGTGVFPNEEKARILWLGVDDEAGSLPKLKEILETECAAVDFAKETRSFNPHLTIARLREPQKSKLLTVRHQRNDFVSETFNANEITIYESRLQKSGSIYHVVSRHRMQPLSTAAENR